MSCIVYLTCVPHFVGHSDVSNQQTVSAVHDTASIPLPFLHSVYHTAFSDRYILNSYVGPLNIWHANRSEARNTIKNRLRLLVSTLRQQRTATKTRAAVQGQGPASLHLTSQSRSHSPPKAHILIAWQVRAPCASASRTSPHLYTRGIALSSFCLLRIGDSLFHSRTPHLIAIGHCSDQQYVSHTVIYIFARLHRNASDTSTDVITNHLPMCATRSANATAAESDVPSADASTPPATPAPRASTTLSSAASALTWRDSPLHSLH